MRLSFYPRCPRVCLSIVCYFSHELIYVSAFDGVSYFIQNLNILMAGFLRVILHAHKILKVFFLGKYNEILKIAKVLASSGTEFELWSHETFTSCAMVHVFNPDTEPGGIL